MNHFISKNDLERVLKVQSYLESLPELQAELVSIDGVKAVIVVPLNSVDHVTAK